MRDWMRKYGTLTAAVVLGALLTAPFLYESVLLMLGRGNDSTLRGAYALMGSDSAADTTVFRALGIAEGIPAVLATVVLVGVAMRRQWAREAGALTFFVFGLVSTAVSLGGISEDSPHAAQGLFVGVASFGVAALLMLKPSVDAVMWHQHGLDRRRAEAARKTG